MRVAVIGYLSLDTITTPDGRWTDVPGGAALYAALAALAAGAQPVLFATAGEDFPQAVLDRAAALGVDVSHVRRAGGPTRRADMRYDAAGDRHSANFDRAAWWQRSLDLVPPPVPDRHFAAAVLGPMPAAALARAITVDARRVLDTSEGMARRDGDALRALASRADAIAMSREETRILWPGDDDAAALALAAHADVMQKRGRDGAFVAARGARAGTLVASVPVSAVDPTGAGDAAVGALAGALALGAPLHDSAAQAMAIAARAVSGLGLGGLGIAP